MWLSKNAVLMLAFIYNNNDDITRAEEMVHNYVVMCMLEKLL